MQKQNPQLDNGEDFSDLVLALGMFLPTALSVDETLKGDQKSLITTSSRKISSDSSYSSDEEDLNLAANQQRRRLSAFPSSPGNTAMMVERNIEIQRGENGMEVGGGLTVFSSSDEEDLKFESHSRRRRRSMLRGTTGGGEVGGNGGEASAVLSEAAGEALVRVEKGASRLKSRLEAAAHRVDSTHSTSLSSHNNNKVDGDGSGGGGGGGGLPFPTALPSPPPKKRRHHRPQQSARHGEGEAWSEVVAQLEAKNIGAGGERGSLPRNDFNGGGNFSFENEDDSDGFSGGGDGRQGGFKGSTRFGESSSSEEEDEGASGAEAGRAGLVGGDNSSSGGGSSGGGGSSRARGVRRRAPPLTTAAAGATGSSSSNSSNSSNVSRWQHRADSRGGGHYHSSSSSLGAAAASARKEVARKLQSERAVMVGDYGSVLAHVLFSACIALLALHFIGTADGITRVVSLEFELLACLCGAVFLLFGVEVVLARRRDRRLNYARQAAARRHTRAASSR